MRDVLIIAKCDKCKKKVEVNDEPLPKWVIDGTTYRPELCQECQDKVLASLDFLTPVTRTKSKPKVTTGKRTGGKFAKVKSPCPVKGCDKVFDTPAGLSQHMNQLVRNETRNGIHRKYLREE